MTVHTFKHQIYSPTQLPKWLPPNVPIPSSLPLHTLMLRFTIQKLRDWAGKTVLYCWLYKNPRTPPAYLLSESNYLNTVIICRCMVPLTRNNINFLCVVYFPPSLLISLPPTCLTRLRVTRLSYQRLYFFYLEKAGLC